MLQKWFTSTKHLYTHNLQNDDPLIMVTFTTIDNISNKNKAEYLEKQNGLYGPPMVQTFVNLCVLCIAVYPGIEQ